MSEFIMTPTNVDFLESIFKNPITGRWEIPLLTYNLHLTNPFFAEKDPLNEDPNYHKSVVDHFYLRLTEKWLYKDSAFRKLVNYFRIDKNGDKGTVRLIENPEQINNEKFNDTDRKYVFKYIEKYFITKKFVDKAIRQYVKSTHIKWYDLFHNTDILKDYLSHKLKKSIISTIYEVEDRKSNKDRKSKNT